MSISRRAINFLRKEVIRNPIFHVPALEVNSSLSEQIFKNGYAVIPSIISPDRVISLRQISEKCFQETSHTKYGEDWTASRFLAVKQLAIIPFEPAIVEILKSVLGERYTTYPNFTFRVNRFTSWHIDNGFHPAFHNNPEHLCDPNFLHIQCAIYLQDNNENFGGGLDILPKSHRNMRKHRSYQSFFVRAARRIANIIRQPISLKTKAGDLILFDSRLVHRGTQPKVPSVQQKYGIFWSTSRTDTEQIDKFMSYLESRSKYLKKICSPQFMIDRYNDVVKIRFPTSYPDEVIKLIKEHNLNIANFS